MPVSVYLEAEMQQTTQYWFPAKHYGWGWGLPLTWQGWLTLAIFVGLVWVGVLIFPPRRALASYVLYLAVLSVLLVAVCWLKGEPPRWRLGGGV
jgi:hypothetical protein